MKQLFINGEWTGGAGERPNVNPSDLSDVIDTYAQADQAMTETAIAAAVHAFPGWSRSGKAWTAAAMAVSVIAWSAWA